MKNDNIFKPASNIVDNCHVDKATYDQMYKESITSPDIFWNNHGKRIDWIKPYTKVSNVSYKRIRYVRRSGSITTKNKVKIWRVPI